MSRDDDIVFEGRAFPRSEFTSRVIRGECTVRAETLADGYFLLELHDPYAHHGLFAVTACDVNVLSAPSLLASGALHAWRYGAMAQLDLQSRVFKQALGEPAEINPVVCTEYLGGGAVNLSVAAAYTVATAALQLTMAHLGFDLVLRGKINVLHRPSRW